MPQVVNLPCELFVEHSCAIAKAAAKLGFTHTAVNTLAGGYCGYVPTMRAFSRTGGYETKHVTSSFLAPEAGEAVLEACVALLTKLRDQIDGLDTKQPER